MFPAQKVITINDVEVMTTPEDLCMILGLPNRGVRVDFTTAPRISIDVAHRYRGGRKAVVMKKVKDDIAEDVAGGDT